LSANRAAIDVAHSYLRSRRDVELDDYADLVRSPPLNAALDDPGPVVTAWRKRIGRSEAVLIAAPEYAGALAGTIKNALDWIVGSSDESNMGLDRRCRIEEGMWSGCRFGRGNGSRSWSRRVHRFGGCVRRCLGLVTRSTGRCAGC
jgi:hypothetical protein